MYEVSFKIKDIGVVLVEKRLVCAASKAEAISIVRMHNEWDGLDAWKYVAKKWM